MDWSPSRQHRLRPAVLGASWLAAFALALLGALLPMPALAEHWVAPETVYVPRTGHTVDGLFLQTWREQRALIGDPITEEFQTKTGLGTDPDQEQVVQYYESAALVYLPDEVPGEQVRTLDLGREALARAMADRPSEALLAATRRTACGGSEARGCIGFGMAGHTLQGDFRAFWEDVAGEQWLGRPITEAYRAPDGSWVQYFERAALRLATGGDVAPLPIGRVSADRFRLDTGRVVRPAEVPLYATALFAAPPEPESEPTFDSELAAIAAPEVETIPEPEPPVGDELDSTTEQELAVEDGTEEIADTTAEVVGPGPQVGEDKEIVVSISAQTLWAYEGGELVNMTLVSTGTAEVPETVTPIGTHRILTKVDVQDMEGTISDEYYFVPDVPNVMYFDDLGNALHGTYWHSNFGTPMSHGCVNLPVDVAAWMYAWAEVGTAVTVIA